MELSAENQAELVSAREQAILLQGLMGARPGAVLGAANTSAPTTAAPSDAAAPSVPSTEGTPTPMDTQAREGKRGSDWDSAKGADKYRRSAQVKGGGYGTGWGNKRQNEWWKKAKNDFDEENKREKDVEAWTKMKEDNPTGLTLPRRAAMLKQLLDLWFIRLEVVAETEESLSQAKNMLILNQAGQ
ncbi:Rptn, partial [Symbiodinium sp. KB8]